MELVDFAVTARKYKTLLTVKYGMRKPYEAPNPKEVKSYIPGTIVELKVKKGDILKEGQTLLILEAMKMMNEVLMPFDGKIKKVYVKKGEKVPKEHLMVLIE